MPANKYTIIIENEGEGQKMTAQCDGKTVTYDFLGVEIKNDGASAPRLYKALQLVGDAVMEGYVLTLLVEGIKDVTVAERVNAGAEATLDRMRKNG